MDVLPVSLDYQTCGLSTYLPPGRGSALCGYVFFFLLVLVLVLAGFVNIYYVLITHSHGEGPPLTVP